MAARPWGDLQNLGRSEALKNFYHRAVEPDISFRRDSAGHEVDLLIDQGERQIPVEITSGQRLAATSLMTSTAGGTRPNRRKALRVSFTAATPVANVGVYQCFPGRTGRDPDWPARGSGRATCCKLAEPAWPYAAVEAKLPGIAVLGCGDLVCIGLPAIRAEM